MPSGFWYLKDGRGFAKRIRIMILLMEEIVSELELDDKAMEFANYLRNFFIFLYKT